MKWRWAVPILVLLACCGADDPKITSEPLCRIPSERSPGFRMLANNDLTKIAAIDQWGVEKKWYVALDSKVWEFYTAADADSMQFSADGRHLSLLAEHDGQWFVITDDKDARPLGRNACSDLTFSPDQKHDACIESTATGLRVLRDGKPLEAGPLKGLFDFISPLAFTPDSAHVYFTAIKADTAYAIMDDKVVGSSEAEIVTRPVLTPKGDELIWGICRQTPAGREVISLTNNEAKQKYAANKASTLIPTLALSPSGAHIAWAEQDEAGTRVCVDGKPSDGQMTVVGDITISPDEKHIAWAGHSNARNIDIVVIDGAALVSYHTLTSSHGAFSADGTHLHIAAKGERDDFAIVGGGWTSGVAAINNKASLTIEYSTWSNGTYANNHSMVGKFIETTLADDNTAIVLTETPTLVYFNDKPLNQVTRSVVKLSGK